ncbi:hypothetical protein L596_000438 [Steinernema carpocapsae]|uniref:Histone acetyltransferase n=1 Tax=Steinernema carpocapsae TaxID=34508 RepID=A0A4U8UJ00_STECR|nr:hypothetical protein L596_000438 [Steinernema carpocapsae]
MKRARGRVPTLAEDAEIRKGEVFLVRRTVGDKEEERIAEVIDVKSIENHPVPSLPSPSYRSSSETPPLVPSAKRVRFTETTPSFSDPNLAAASAASAAANNAALKYAEKFAADRARDNAQRELEAAVRGIQNFGNQDDEDEEDGSPVKEPLMISGPEIPRTVNVTIYYVHFLNSDRRMDTWLDRSKFIERKSPDIVVTTPVAPLPDGPLSASLMTRSQKRIHEEFNHVQKAFSDMDATTAALERAHEEFTKVKNLATVEYGSYEIDAWYFSPYPESVCTESKLYICEYCLAYMPDKKQYDCHKSHICQRRQPPGDEIYRCGNLSIFEVDGKTNKTYCQCLCLLSKLFMDHKTLYFDVELFLFYIICEVDHRGAHLVGHFSKERNSINNLACIMILPPFQRKGYGKLLIQLSYALSTREGVVLRSLSPILERFLIEAIGGTCF